MKNIEDMNKEELECYGNLIELAKSNTEWEKLGCLSYRKIGKRTYVKHKLVNTYIDDNANIERLVFLERVISDSNLKISKIGGIWFGNANGHIENSWNFQFYLEKQQDHVENICVISLCGSDVYLSDNTLSIAIKVGSLSNPDIFKNIQKIQNEFDLFRKKYIDICTDPQKYYQKILEL